jgi:hypothetical protein
MSTVSSATTSTSAAGYGLDAHMLYSLAIGLTVLHWLAAWISSCGRSGMAEDEAVIIAFLYYLLSSKSA